MAVKRDLYFDALTNDITTGSNYDIRLTVNAGEWLSAKLQHRLQMFRGEWYLDQTIGVPYFQDILKKQTDLNQINAIFLSAISETEGVEEILEFTTELDSATRVYSVSFTVRAESGEIVTGEASI